ncbi:MAG: DUF4258 domain-containing protein [Oceanicaulis sp.]|nr:DUF4258 domain-containing protein [Oceanicaulis sp.]
MSNALEAIKRLVATGEFRISDHGYDELSEDRIRVRDVVEGVEDARVVEDYPDFPKGPAVLVLQFDSIGEPFHVVWGIPKGLSAPAVLVTAYRPDPARWQDDFLERRR